MHPSFGVMRSNFFVCQMEETEKRARLPFSAPEVIAKLESISEEALDDSEGEVMAKEKLAIWHPEYANWMIEATPAAPYDGTLDGIVRVQDNMANRRKLLLSVLTDGQEVFTLPVFPRLGCESFTVEDVKPDPNGEVSKSMYIPDASIQPHPRFPTLTRNIRERRGEKVLISVPAFQDKNTASTMETQAKKILDNEGGNEILAQLGDNSIYMDAMAFGMGAGCLQVTFQSADVSQARLLYDQLAVLGPIMLAMTAASPIWKGILADIDARWNIISASVDDRPREERGPKESSENKVLPKSRYSTIDCYISESDMNREHFNDVAIPMDETSYEDLLSQGIDSRMARHVAHLFVRDPLVIFEDKLSVNNETQTDHMENLWSTNWNSVRFKPPPLTNPHGIQWRVEFRTMELGLTDFENAAFSSFMILLAQTIAAKKLDLYMPISKVDENMDRAHKRNAVENQKFYFRQCVDCHLRDEKLDSRPCVKEFTMDQIVNGDSTLGMKGLVGLVRDYVNERPGTKETLSRIELYLDFISLRASGKIPTTAEWLRQEVLSHEAYKFDSVVSEEICYDLLIKCKAIAEGQANDKLYGKLAPMVAESCLTGDALTWVHRGLPDESESNEPATKDMVGAGESESSNMFQSPLSPRSIQRLWDEGTEGSGEATESLGSVWGGNTGYFTSNCDLQSGHAARCAGFGQQCVCLGCTCAV
mmetsp:Transcript_9837/g.32906  ORF Transcript_9837/g.32906 Transcript_9837/m.32906 type:complete len:705 (-) Transcript_9837:68-2182(-)